MNEDRRRAFIESIREDKPILKLLKYMVLIETNPDIATNIIS
jgi:hypothetical protein